MRRHDVIGHTSADDQYLETPPGAAYEHTDASVRLVVRFLCWLAVSAVVIHLGLALLFNLFVEQREVRTPPRYPLAARGQGLQMPPEPRLQRFPREDISTFRTGEESLLTSYGWADREAGTVHIPIDEAMKLTLKRGLPTRGRSAAAPVTDRVPTDSSAGR